MFIILSTCTSLRRLNVCIHRFGAEALSETLQGALNGLECFDMKLLVPGTRGEVQDMTEQESTIIATVTKAVTTKRGKPLIIPKKAVEELVFTAWVDFRGEERVHKPDKISSRTRRRSNMCGGKA